jgi:hypothetical protein
MHDANNWRRLLVSLALNWRTWNRKIIKLQKTKWVVITKHPEEVLRQLWLKGKDLL